MINNFNISIIHKQLEVLSSSGPYGEKGYIYQAAHMPPKFGENHTLIGTGW